jgi:hypothetical protein
LRPSDELPAGERPVVRRFGPVASDNDAGIALAQGGVPQGKSNHKNQEKPDEQVSALRRHDRHLDGQMFGLMNLNTD